MFYQNFTELLYLHSNPCFSAFQSVWVIDSAKENILLVFKRFFRDRAIQSDATINFLNNK